MKKIIISIIFALITVSTLVAQTDTVLNYTRPVVQQNIYHGKTNISSQFLELVVVDLKRAGREARSLRYSYVPNHWGFYVDVPFRAFASGGVVYRLTPVTARVDLQVYGGVELHFGKQYPFKYPHNAVNAGFRIAPGASTNRSSFAWTSMSLGLHYDSRHNPYLAVGMSTVTTGAAVVGFLAILAGTLIFR